MNVDDGEETTCPLSDLRLIPTRFMTQQLLTVRARLHGVKPPNQASEWDLGSTREAATFLAGKDRLICHVEVAATRELPASVLLYESYATKLICLNSALALEDLVAAASPNLPEAEHFKTDPALLLRRASGGANGDQLPSCSGYLFDLSADVDASYRRCTILRAFHPDKLFISTENDADYERLDEEMMEYYAGKDKETSNEDVSDF